LKEEVELEPPKSQIPGHVSGSLEEMYAGSRSIQAGRAVFVGGGAASISKPGSQESWHRLWKSSRSFKQRIYFTFWKGVTDFGDEHWTYWDETRRSSGSAGEVLNASLRGGYDAATLSEPPPAASPFATSRVKSSGSSSDS